jgi:hypothetical protein
VPQPAHSISELFLQEIRVPPLVNQSEEIDRFVLNRIVDVKGKRSRPTAWKAETEACLSIFNLQIGFEPSADETPNRSITRRW